MEVTSSSRTTSLDPLAAAESVPEGFPLTVVILARNEAENLARCLDSVSWCNDRLVVDDGSTDGTVEMAMERGARVVSHRFESFASQRNWAIESASPRNPWVLMLDADEELTAAGRLEVERELSRAGDGIAAFRMCRKTMFLGQWIRYCDGFPVWIMRLVHRDRARFVDQGHGELPVPPVSGAMGTLREPFIHYPFHRGLAHWLRRHISYAEREAALELRQKASVRLGDLWSRDTAARRLALRNLSRTIPGRPVLRFAYQYLWKWGFLDGRAGLAFSTLMAVYEAMIVVMALELRRRGLDPARAESGPPPR